MSILICAPDIFGGDAVGNHCLGIARTARRLGFDTRLFAQRFNADSETIHPIDELFDTAKRGDVLVVSYSIFDPFLERLTQLACEKVCYFHGVTDPALLRTFEPQTADLCEAALVQLPLLNRFDRVVANSRFSANALTGIALRKPVQIVPPVFADMYALSAQPFSPAGERTALDLLVVGRVVPHKRIEDAIEVLHGLTNRDVNASLSVVGTMPNYEYSKYLINHARRLGVLERVDFKGMLDDAMLIDCFGRASALLATSRHEGFCVPVLEMMHFGKPAIVRAGTAAEELCSPPDVIAQEAGPDVWVDRLVALTEQTPDDGIASHAAYAARAAGILERCSDSVWGGVLAQSSAEGQK